MLDKITRRMMTVFPIGLAAQTKISIDQIRPNQILISETLTPEATNKLELTLTATPANGFIQLFINGLQTRPGRDFTITGNKITLITAYMPVVNDSVSTFDVYYYK